MWGSGGGGQDSVGVGIRDFCEDAVVLLSNKKLFSIDSGKHIIYSVAHHVIII